MEDHLAVHHGHHWPVIGEHPGIHGYVPVDQSRIKLEHGIHIGNEGVKLEPIDPAAMKIPNSGELAPGAQSQLEQYQNWVAHHYGHIPQYPPTLPPTIPHQYHSHENLQVQHPAIGFA